MSRYLNKNVRIHGIILQAGVYNLSNMSKFRPLLYNHWIKDYKLCDSSIANRDSRIKDKSISNYINKYNVNLYIFHGTKDMKANIEDMHKFMSRLNCNYNIAGLRLGKHALDKYQKIIYETIKHLL